MCNIHVPCMHIHVHTHSHTFSYIHTYTHTNIHTPSIHRHQHTHSHTFTHTFLYTDTHNFFENFSILSEEGGVAQEVKCLLDKCSGTLTPQYRRCGSRHL